MQIIIESSIRKLVRLENSRELMVKLNNKKIRWSVNQVVKGNKSCKEITEIYETSERWIQVLVKKYKDTNSYPIMNWKRRPKICLTEEQKALIDKGYSETYFGAMMLRHHIRTAYGINIPQNKMHYYMIERGYSKPNPKKQKQRKRCRYERDHSLSLLHADWTEYLGKQTIGFEDDASRKMLSLLEFDNANTKNTIKALETARNNLGELAPFIIAINTDRDAQFIGNKKNDNDEAYHKFVEHINSLGIKHIPSRVKNPQTNGKIERWFQEYKKHRHKFKSAEEFRVWYNNKIHGALKYRRGETPEKAFIKKIDPSVWIGLRFKLINL